jgi:general stress protein CsbA
MGRLVRYYLVTVVTVIAISSSQPKSLFIKQWVVTVAAVSRAISRRVFTELVLYFETYTVFV